MSSIENNAGTHAINVERLAETWASAAAGTLAEMAFIHTASTRFERGGMSIVPPAVIVDLPLHSANVDRAVIWSPQDVATALARRILSDVTDSLDVDLVADCMGEVANVIAGQAKAMLADSTDSFSFGVPRSRFVEPTAAEVRLPSASLAISLMGDTGALAIVLIFKQ